VLSVGQQNTTPRQGAHGASVLNSSRDVMVCVQMLALHYFLYNYCLFLNTKVCVVWWWLRGRWVYRAVAESMLSVGPTGHDAEAGGTWGRAQRVNAG
jgi:hypothetical protein